MNNEPYVSGINPHFLHTKELARCRSENALFPGVVYILFSLSLSRFCNPTVSLPWNPILPFSNSDLLEQPLPYDINFNTYYIDF